MYLHFIRHAQSQANAKVPGAPIDCTLTDLGLRQAEAAGRRLAEIGIDRVLASPYTRALQTADAIRRATGAPAEVVPLLHEHHIKPFAGEEWPLLSRDTLANRFPDFALPADFAFAPRWHDVPETDEGVLRRARGLLQDLWYRFATAPDGNQEIRLAIVSHGSPTGKMVMASLGIETTAHTAIRIDNASITSVEYWPEWRVLLASNRIDHLAHLIGPGPDQMNLTREDPGFPQSSVPRDRIGTA